MNEAFENAFYQLDKDRDGVVTLRDLERYVRENNLKDKFIQKWLTLFADDKNVIYYDKFCETMGIVPAPEKFDQKTYKIDMSEETRATVVGVIKEFADQDEELSGATLNSVLARLSGLLGDKWQIKLDPTKSELDVKYAPDGLLYYSQKNSGKPKILVYREELDPEDGDGKEIIYESIMSDSVREGVLESVRHNNTPNCDITSKTDSIVNVLNQKYGMTWHMLINPSEKQLKVDYDYEGKIYFSPNSKENLKILIWRKDKEKIRGKMCFCCF